FRQRGVQYARIGREQGETVARVFEIDSHVSPEALEDVDVCIDFSMPTAVLDNIRAAVKAKRDIVFGTTGWYDHLPELKESIRESGLLYSANFSVGMNYF